MTDAAQCDRIRINYGWALNGHYIWRVQELHAKIRVEKCSPSRRYNYNPGDVPDGKHIEVDNEGTC